MIGFQFSLVSGSGITFGKQFNNNVRLRGTAGIIANDDRSQYSVGFDLQYILSQDERFTIFMGPSFGVISGNKESTKNRVALTTGIELPLTGGRQYRNICLGLLLHYPTYYTVSKNINVTPGAYLSYNF